MISPEKKFILSTFLKLTDNTYPYGTEEILVKKMKADGLFPEGMQKDAHGNYFLKVGESRTVFTSHFDTVSKAHTRVKHVFESNMIKTDGTTTLGADDKAGVTIMLWMIKNGVPGVYYFFMGEEVGCVGSGNAAKSVSDFKGRYDRMVSFDRRGTDSVITHQSYSRCCSERFAQSLANQLNAKGRGFKYKTDDTGIYTDSAEFTEIIAECTNISVGYYKEHSHNESQDIDHLERLADACVLVDWEGLPTERDINKTEFKKSSYDYSGYGTTKTGGHSWRNDDFRWGGYGGGIYEGDDDWVNDDDWHFLKSKKKGAPKSKSYYDDGGDLVEFDDYSGTKYSHFMSKFTGKLEMEELDIIREQYLDMNDYNDIVFYEYLLEYISDSAL